MGEKRKQRLFLSLAAVVLLALFSWPAFSDTYYVPDTFPSVQAALNGSVTGDIIIVRDGVYSGVDNRNLDFDGKALTLRSEHGPARCVIDCEGGGRAFIFNSGETSASVVDGFRIRNGYVFGGGAAVYCYNSSPTISNCVFSGNSVSGFGGAVVSTNLSAPTFRNCTITANRVSGFGGAIVCKNGATAALTNCILWGNYASNYAPEIAVIGDSSLSIDFSCVEGGEAGAYVEAGSVLLWGGANTASDPEFVDPLAENYHLAFGSSCVNAGTGDGVVGDGATDMGAFPAVTVDDDPGRDYANINDALNAPLFDGGYGGSVVVYDGVYPETITMKEHVDLLGAGAGASILDSSSSVLFDGISNSYLRGFTVVGLSHGVTTRNGAAPVISNNVITSLTGSGIRCEDSSRPLILRNTFTNVYADAVLVRDGSSPVIVNNIISNAASGITVESDGSPVIEYNNIWYTPQPYSGCSPGVHDISVDPMYEDAANDDYRLHPCSPCIDAGDPVEKLTLDYLAASSKLYVNEVTNIEVGSAIWITDGLKTERDTVADANTDMLWLANGFANDYLVANGAYVFSVYSEYVGEPEPNGARVNMGAYGGSSAAATSESITDDDGDTYSECQGDCDDGNDEVNPGAQEVCNGIDDDCDGLLDIEDPDCANVVTYYRDDDQDAYGIDGDTRILCSPEAPYTATRGGDCDDAEPAVNPGAEEVCNGIDDDCDELTDADDPDCVGAETYYRDDDQDDYGVTDDSLRLCAPESPYTALAGGDCDDANAAVKPTAQEVCNGIDDDCDDLADADDPDCIALVTYYRDEDQDGYGIEGDARHLCAPEVPYTALITGDCDDGSDSVYPGAPEIPCDGIDQDCDQNDLCTCRLVVDDVAAAPGDFVTMPVRVETACVQISALGFDFDYSQCEMLGYMSYSGVHIRGSLTANWDFFDAYEVAPGIIRVGGFTVQDPVSEGESGIIVELEFEISTCSPDNVCNAMLTNLVSDISNWPAAAGGFSCYCPADGDIDGDTQVTPGDALLAFQEYLGIIQLDDCERNHADVDEDGHVTPSDALCIFQCYMGIPCPNLCP